MAGGPGLPRRAAAGEEERLSPGTGGEGRRLGWPGLGPLARLTGERTGGRRGGVSPARGLGAFPGGGESLGLLRGFTLARVKPLRPGCALSSPRVPRPGKPLLAWSTAVSL